MTVDERMDFSTNVVVGNYRRTGLSVMVDGLVDGCVRRKLPANLYNPSVKYYRR